MTAFGWNRLFEGFYFSLYDICKSKDPNHKKALWFSPVGQMFLKLIKGDIKVLWCLNIVLSINIFPLHHRHLSFTFKSHINKDV